MSETSKKEEDAEYLRRTANEAQLWWVRAMQRTVEVQKGPQGSSSKFQAALRDSQRREQELRAALEAKEAELLQLQNSSKMQIGQLHRALQESRKSLTDAGTKQDGGPPDAQPSAVLPDKGKSGGALAAQHDKSCFSGLFAFLHSKQAAVADVSSRALPAPSEKDIADAKAAKLALEGAQSEAAKAKDALSAAEAAHSAEKDAHSSTREALEEKLAALQQERDDLAAHLSEESARSESRAEAFKRLQLQTSTERSRDAELMDQQKMQIRQLTVDLNNLHRDLEGKCLEVKRLEELREAAVQELMQGPTSQSAQPSPEAEQLDDLARALHEESEALADKAQKAQQQLNLNKSQEAVDRLFDIMDDNRDGVVSPAEFEAHRVEYERVVAENSKLSEDVKMLSALREEVEALATECRRLQEQEVRLKTDNEHLSFVKGQVQELSSNYDQLIAENDGLRRDKEQSMALQAATEQTLQEKIAEAYRLQDEKQSLEQEATAMRRQLADHDAAKAVALEPPPDPGAEAPAVDQAALDAALEDKVSEIAMLKAEVERVLKESDALQTGLDNSMAMNDRLEHERAELTGALQSLDDQSQALAQERDQWQAEFEAARQALEQQDANIQDLVNKNMVQAAEVSALGDLKVKLEEDLDATLQKLQQLEALQQEQQAQAEQTNSGGSLPSSSPRPQMREIAEQEAQAQLAWLGAQNTRLKGEVDSLISALDERAIENQRLHADLEAASQGAGAAAALQADNSRLEKEIAVMTGTLEDFRAANARLQEQLIILEGREPQVLMDPKLPEEIDALQSDRSRTQQELEVMTVKYEEHAAENQRLQQELAQVAMESQRERERLEAEVARVTQEHQHEIHQLHREMALVHSNAEENQDARRAELSQALRESGEELDKLMAQIADQQTELAGLREENRTLTQVRDKAGVLAGEFDAQQADAARLRAENATLLSERQELAVQVEDATAEKNKALQLAGEFRASSLVRPWFNRSGATYLDSVCVDYASHLDEASPVQEANQANTAVMSERIETGDTVRTAQQRYQLALSEVVSGAAVGAPGGGVDQVGAREVLDWDTYAITDFVQAVFHQYGLVPPGETLIFNLYRLFDPEPSKGYLEEEEAICLADAALRVTFALPQKGEEQQPIEPVLASPELVDQMSREKEQQAEEMENLVSQFAQLQAQLRRAEARASAAERERDAMERALVREDALTASRGSRASVRTSPERATTHMFALSDGFAPPTATAVAPAAAPTVVVSAAAAPASAADSGLLYMSSGGWQSPPVAAPAPQQVVAMSSPQVVAGRMAQPVLVAEPQVRSCLTTSEVPTTVVTRQWATTAPVSAEAPLAAFVYS